MKTIIICEGLHDGYFLNSIFNNLSIDLSSVKFFCQKNVSLPEKKDAETKVIRSFIENNSYNPYKILVKQEGGKDSATKIFARELKRFLTDVDKFILLLDLDRSTPKQKMGLLQRIISSSYGNTTPLTINSEKTKSNNHLFHYSCSIVNKNEIVLGEFQIILFKVSLEHSCTISDNDKKEDIIPKINNFIEKEKIDSFFKKILTN